MIGLIGLIVFILFILFILGIVIQVVCNSNEKKWLGIIPPIYFFGFSIIAIIAFSPFIELVIYNMRLGFIEEGFTHEEVDMILSIVKVVYFIIFNITTLISAIISIIHWIVYKVKNRKNKMNNNNNLPIQENNESMN